MSDVVTILGKRQHTSSTVGSANTFLDLMFGLTPANVIDHHLAYLVHLIQ